MSRGVPGDRTAFDFTLSSRDKAQPVPKFSVYVKGLTTERQACLLVGDGTTHRLIARLRVAAIRAISAQDYRLNAVWDDALLDDGTPDARPGVQGHAGITGLNRPPNVEKLVFKKLQARLVNAVGDDYLLLPESV